MVEPTSAAVLQVPDPAGQGRRSLLKGLGAAAVMAGVTASRPALAQPATPVADVVATEFGIAYAEVGGRGLLLNVYALPQRDAPRPAVIVLHPGGFYGGDRSWMEGFARGLAEVGYVALAIDYRLYDAAGDQPLWPAPLIDAQRAVRWTRANAATYGIDPERIAAFGYSAGGMLALQLGMRDTLDASNPELAAYSSRVACVVNIAAMTDAALPWVTPDDTDPQPRLLGGSAEEAPAAYADFAVLTHVDEKAAPTLILHSSDDTWTPVAHAWRLAESLSEAGVEVVLCDLANVEHPDWTWANAGPWTLAFLSRQFSPVR